MKKNVYGNIEDMIVHIKMVTPKGVVQRNCQAPRISSGPDIHQIILGSEGILGVITEVIMKVRPIPAYKKYGSIVFPKFDLGVETLKEVVDQQLRPASMRLMDNAQFIFGQALKPEAASLISSLADRVAKYYLTQVKKLDMKKICVVTLLLEGTKKVSSSMHHQCHFIFSKQRGLPAGEENGKRGYMLTFVIAYLRDLALDFGILSESFETSVPWDKVIDLCKNVKYRIEKEVSRYAIPNPPLVSCRVTQSYDVGACVYFYFAFSCLGVSDAITIYEEIEMAARDEVLANGGSISHHHGVGKLRKPWMKQTVSDTGLEMLQAVKSSMDPSNIFASGNLLDVMKIQSSL
ncbi:unnamed protein product [Larinioides sclopetarius]|uniref:Alkylglycerone-phosphate synthase n=1 Tax=Larinioides sclopetarius TaxID=280406 RepID=A0AAV1ZVR1_9ARAC